MAAAPIGSFRNRYGARLLRPDLFLFNIDTPRRHPVIASIFRLVGTLKTEAGQYPNDLITLDDVSAVMRCG